MFEKKERDLFNKSDPVETSTFAQLDKEKIFWLYFIVVKLFVKTKKLCTVFIFDKK
ncbi:MAG TPA: hypothetical protein VLK22_01925 [Candidatus Udaeobacter sp.]|nr:hypothetical protein [Candidatus Udaeobacter sp.]